jgi:ATP-dependent Clp protease ATP-binding subunit ClpA
MLPFTPRLRLAIASAEAKASTQQPLDVRPSHLLAGVLSLGSGLPVGVLKARGFTDSDAAAAVSRENTLSDMPASYTPEALRALSDAIMEAVSRSHSLVGLEHLLVGLLVQPSADILALLVQKNINSEELLSSLRAEM